LHILKEMPYNSDIDYLKVEYGVHLPKLKVMKRILNYCLALKLPKLDELDETYFEHRLSTLVMF
jgi:hypothetical protein